MLESEDLFLRPLERHDVQERPGWINRPDILVPMGVYGPRSLDEQLRWYDALVGNRRNRVFAVCLREDNQHVGNASLFDIDHLNGSAGLTVFIGDDSYRGRGLGTQAVWCLCRFGFDHLNLQRLTAKTDVDAAARMYASLGFVHEGTLRRASFQDGTFVDKQLFAVLRGELVAPPSVRGGA